MADYFLTLFTGKCRGRLEAFTGASKTQVPTRAQFILCQRKRINPNQNGGSASDIMHCEAWGSDERYPGGDVFNFDLWGSGASYLYHCLQCPLGAVTSGAS